MLVTILVLVGLLALGPQAVLSKFNSISFSTIEQCGSFNVSFSGGKPPATLPLILTVVPFNLVPISITIPASSWNDTTQTGAFVTFLPLSAGTTFVASLDDAAGNGTGLVSDVIKIEPSNNSSCLPANSTQPSEDYKLEGGLVQCQSFNILYDAGVHPTAPSIRAFTPKGPSFTVHQDLTSSSPGVGTYLMDAFRGQQVALLYDDGEGTRQVSDLLTVDGDTSSSTSCLPSAQPIGDAEMANSSSSSSRKLSSAAIIAIGVVSGTVVGVTLILLALFFYRERSRRLARLNKEIAWLEAGRKEIPDTPGLPPSPPPKLRREPSPIRANPSQSRYLADPPYPTENFISLSSPTFLSSRRAGNSGELRVDVPPLGGSRASGSRRPSLLRTPTSAARSISSLDIEGILEMAATGSQLPDDARSIASQSINRPTLPPPAQRPGGSPGPLGLKRSDETLDVPLSAAPFGRFSGLSMDIERGSSVGVRSGVSIGNAPFAKGHVVAGRSDDYKSHKGSIGSRPILDSPPRAVTVERGRARTGEEYRGLNRF